MLVSQILSAKASAEIVTVRPDASVAEAAELLSQKRIGALVVSSGGAPEGILSERDIVRELGKRGASVLEEKVSALMTARLITCSPRDQTVDVVMKMTDGRFRHMPVMEEGKMVGLVSIGDVVKARLGELSMERDALEGMIMGQ